MEDTYFFSIASITEDCGEFAYELLDSNTGLALEPPIFSIVTDEGPQPFVRGAIPKRDPYLAESPLQL